MTKEQEIKIGRTIRHVVDLLVHGRYTQIESISNGVQLNADEMRNEIELYGCLLVPPPPEAYESIDIVPIVSVETVYPEFSVRFFLYTREEGRSDLELQATLADDGNKMMNVEIDGILVA